MPAAIMVGLGVFAAVGPKAVDLGARPVVEAGRDLVGASPLQVVTVGEFELWTGIDWALPTPWRTGGERGAALETPAFARTMRERGGASVNRSRFKLVMENKRSYTVVITGMRAVVTRKGEPFSGTLLKYRSGGGPSPSLTLTFNLDGHDRSARAKDGGERYFDQSHIKLVPGEIVTFVIESEAAKASYDWKVEIEYTLDGGRRTQLVPEGSAAFRITGSAPAYRSTVQVLRQGD